MTSLLRLAVACLAAISLVAGAGCGSDTKSSNDYVKANNKVPPEFARDVQKVGPSAPSGTGPAAKAKQTFSDLGAAIDKAVTDLRGVDPADAVRDRPNQLS